MIRSYPRYPYLTNSNHSQALRSVTLNLRSVQRPPATSFACRYNRILVTSIFFHDRSDLEAYNMCTYMTPFFSDFLMSTNSFLKK